MTQDFMDQLTEAFQKEGYEYLILSWKDLNQGAHIVSSLRDLDEEYKFPERTTTKRESIMELAEYALQKD